MMTAFTNEFKITLRGCHGVHTFIVNSFSHCLFGLHLLEYLDEYGMAMEGWHSRSSTGDGCFKNAFLMSENAPLCRLKRRCGVCTIKKQLGDNILHIVSYICSSLKCGFLPMQGKG